MKPQQLNGTYYAEEDRIMLRIKSFENTEYRFWLTRLITQRILEVIEKISIQNITTTTQSKTLSQGVVEVIDEMQQKAIKNETDLTKPYEPASQLPLGGDPKLILEASFTVKNASDIGLKITTKNHPAIEFELNMGMLAKIRILLDELNHKARWNVTSQDKVVTTENITPPPHALH